MPTQAVRIHAAGHDWSGQWQIDGEDLVLASAYGCRRRRIGRADRAQLAEQLMREILVDHAHGRGPRWEC